MIPFPPAPQAMPFAACYRGAPLPRRIPLQSQAAIEGEIRTFLSENFPLSASGTVEADQSLVESGVIDSLGVLELVEFLDERYGLQIAEEELVPENLDSIARIVRFVSSKVGADTSAENELDRA